MTEQPTDVTENQPVPLKEYEWYVGHMQLTGMLTEEMAERMDAKPIGTSTEDDAPKPGEVPNRTAEQAASENAQPDAAGVDGPDAEGINKSRTTRNRRAQ